jgi:hypothetical protein
MNRFSAFGTEEPFALTKTIGEREVALLARSAQQSPAKVARS